MPTQRERALALVLEGYAVLLNPTVPIVYESGGMTEQYLPQLVASADAAVDYLVKPVTEAVLVAKAQEVLERGSNV